MARRSKPSDAPVPTFDEAEKTQVSFVPDFEDDTDDLDGPTLDEPAPAVASPKPRLRLPVPGEPDPEPDPRPALKQGLSLPAPEAYEPPPGARMPQGQGRGTVSVPVYAPEPKRKGSHALIFGVLAILLTVVMVAFAVAPDGRSAEEIQHARRAGLQEPQRARSRGVLERLGLGESDSEVAEARRQAAAARARRSVIASNPAPKKTRRANLDLGKRAKANLAPEDVRYGFEPTERKAERRLYDNFDSSKQMSTGIPMLMVFTKPRGMNVEVDGQLLGMSPLIRPLPKDTRRVKVRLSGAGFKAWEKSISANELEQFKVGVTMERIVE